MEKFKKSISSEKKADRLLLEKIKGELAIEILKQNNNVNKITENWEEFGRLLLKFGSLNKLPEYSKEFNKQSDKYNLLQYNITEKWKQCNENTYIISNALLDVNTDLDIVFLQNIKNNIVSSNNELEQINYECKVANEELLNIINAIEKNN